MSMPFEAPQQCHVKLMMTLMVMMIMLMFMVMMVAMMVIFVYERYGKLGNTKIRIRLETLNCYEQTSP